MADNEPSGIDTRSLSLHKASFGKIGPGCSFPIGAEGRVPAEKNHFEKGRRFGTLGTAVPRVLDNSQNFGTLGTVHRVLATFRIYLRHMMMTPSEVIRVAATLPCLYIIWCSYIPTL